MCVSIEGLVVQMETENLIISAELIESHFSEELYNDFVKVLLEDISAVSNFDEYISPYIFPIENIKKIASSDDIKYKENIRNMADSLWNQSQWLHCAIVYYILMHIITFLPTDFYKLGYSMAKLNHKNLAEQFIEIYKKVSANKKVTNHAMANFYYTGMELPYKAIEYFEKYFELEPNNPIIWLSYGHCLSNIDDEVSKKKQLEAYTNAYNLKPNDATIVKSLLTYYEKEHNEEKIKELYPKLLELAPSPRHSLNYGLYLMSWGELNKGGKYFTDRFDLDKYPVGYPKSILGMKTKWNYKDDISDKILLIHYEEGFGDSIMYSRFLPLIKQYAKKTVLIVQEQLVKLFENSPVISDGVEIMSDIKEFISKYKNEEYVHMPLMDMPYPLGADVHFLPYAKSYLTAENPVQYNSDKLKIGIAYSGDVSANYNGRDIRLEEFVDISRTDGVQLYSLQVGETRKQLNTLPDDVSIIDLGKDFKDFSDTANAIMGMDLIISTDNVILNLSGALGKKTYAIFNKYPNYRWFNLSGDNVVWYESVRPFRTQKENDFSSVMKDIKTVIEKEDLNG